MGHLQLVDFCVCFQALYGPENCTPNMHMACHLKDCILDFGVLSSFWCFPFERLNGTLEGMKKSWIFPEKQMFLKFNNLQSFTMLDQNSGEFLNLLSKEPLSAIGSASIDQSFCSDLISLEMMKNYNCPINEIVVTEQRYQKLIPPLYERCFSDVEFDLLTEMYHQIYRHVSIVWLSRFYMEAKKLTINSEEYLSTK